MLNWERLYQDFSACVTDGDCATLCCSDPQDIPACCNSERLALVVFADELAWARSRTTCWHGRRPRTTKERCDVANWAEHVALARCVHPRRCDRPHRSLTCRLFPLEPYLDREGRLVGLTYVASAARVCPLISRQIELRQEFVDQSYLVWREILAAFPEERTCYRNVSRRLRARLTKQGRTIRVFRPTLEDPRALNGEAVATTISAISGFRPPAFSGASL